MKKILVIQGHPRSESLCDSIAREYAAAQQGGSQVDMLDLPALKFDPILREGYKADQQLEPDLVKAQQLIRDADHLVFVFPSWWASMPALLKGFLDRVFLPGFAFKYQKKSPLPEKLLKGKTARIFITMDAPGWYYRWFNGAPGLRLLKFGTLEFCGVKPVKYNIFGPVRGAPEKRLQKFLNEARRIGAEEAK
jgi:NAD(P)H dehydrogenase (quinone)